MCHWRSRQDAYDMDKVQKTITASCMCELPWEGLISPYKYSIRHPSCNVLRQMTANRPTPVMSACMHGTMRRDQYYHASEFCVGMEASKVAKSNPNHSPRPYYKANKVQDMVERLTLFHAGCKRERRKTNHAESDS